VSEGRTGAGVERDAGVRARVGADELARQQRGGGGGGRPLGGAVRQAYKGSVTLLLQI
jgi:hypothetical protein